MLAASLGCEVHEGYANPCPLWGVEIGGLLYNAFVFGWLSMISAPTGAGAALVGLVLVLLSPFFRHKR